MEQKDNLSAAVDDMCLGIAWFDDDKVRSTGLERNTEVML